MIVQHSKTKKKKHLKMAQPNSAKIESGLDMKETEYQCPSNQTQPRLYV